MASYVLAFSTASQLDSQHPVKNTASRNSSIAASRVSLRNAFICHSLTTVVPSSSTILVQLSRRCVTSHRWVIKCDYNVTTYTSLCNIELTRGLSELCENWPLRSQQYASFELLSWSFCFCCAVRYWPWPCKDKQMYDACYTYTLMETHRPTGLFVSKQVHKFTIVINKTFIPFNHNYFQFHSWAPHLRCSPIILHFTYILIRNYMFFIVLLQWHIINSSVSFSCILFTKNSEISQARITDMRESQ
jgi:hypothetical protein